MAKVHCYLPGELKERADRAELNLSRLLRVAVITALREADAGEREPAPASASG